MQISFGIGAALAVSCIACADLYRLGDYTTRADEADPPAYVAPTPSSPVEKPLDAGPSEPRCATNAECGGGICAESTHRCAPLVSPECPRVVGDISNHDAVIVGTILDPILERAAVLAASELYAPLVVVACDPGSPLAAARHLADDLHVPAILGPGGAEDVIDVTQEVSTKSGTLVLTPTSPATAISNLADSDLTWRVAPSDAQRAALVISQMAALEDVLKSTRGLTAVKLAIVHRTDMLGTSARDAVSGKLVLNGRFLSDAANAPYVAIDSYANATSATDPFAAIVARYAGTFRPDIVFLTAPEQVDGLLVPLEKALAAARVVNKPYYVVTEPARSQALLDAVAAPGMPLDLKRRIRGVASVSDPESAVVRAAFESRLGAKTTFAEAATYDAMYAVALAILGSESAKAAKLASGATVAKGLRRLGVGPNVTVGPDHAVEAKTTLASGKSVSLRGASALLKWDATGDIATGTVEVWCVGTSSGAPAFGSSGVAMDVGTQVVAGTFLQCQ